MKRKSIQPTAPIPPANDKPLINRAEMERSQATLTSRQWTDEEREYYLSTYGPPKQPLHKHFSMNTSQGRVRPSLSRS